MADRSLGELFSQLTGDLGALMHDELELAKSELKADIQEVGKGGGLLGGAAFAAYMAVIALSFAAAWGLAELVPVGLAFLIVGLVWAAGAAVLYVSGRRTLQDASLTPEATVETLKEDVAWAKHLKS
jgi:Putative Actinobacterial Holin-X, holin superfamily III